MQTYILNRKKLLLKSKKTLNFVIFTKILKIKDRWPNWIRRSATNREIPDSSSGRSTKKEGKNVRLAHKSITPEISYLFFYTYFNNFIIFNLCIIKKYE